MLDIAREAIHNVVNANEVLPPSTEKLQDQTQISPQISSVTKELAFSQLLLSFSLSFTTPFGDLKPGLVWNPVTASERAG